MGADKRECKQASENRLILPKRQRVDRGEDRGGGGDGGGGGGGRGGVSPSSPAQSQKRRCRSLDLENRGCSCCRHHQELYESSFHRLETSFDEFKQEVKEMLTSLVKCHPDPRERIVQNRQSPSYKLIFENSMGEKLFTRREVRAADGVQIRIVSSSQNSSNVPCHLSTASVKIIVLDGDFNADNREVWTSEEFDDHAVRPRDKAGALLAGKLDVKLKNGEGFLHDVTFIDNSSFTRSGKFKLGVKIVGYNGEEVQEGISEPFTVKDRHGEGYKKNDIPSREDELWRLKRVRKNGTFQKALERSGICSVEGFLRQYHKDENALRNIVKASPSAWTTIIDHAKKCDPGRVDDKNIRLYFSSLGQIVGASVAGQYKAFDDLDTFWKMDFHPEIQYGTLLDSHPEIQNGTPDTNCNTGSGAMDSTTDVEEIIDSVAQNQRALTMQENYQIDYTSDGFSLDHWYSEQQVASQYASPFSPSIQADFPLYSRQNSFMDQQYICTREDDNSVMCTHCE